MSASIIVFLKQVADNTKLKFNDAGPVFDGVPMMLNPYDEYALETAIRLKEAAGADATLTAITLGAPSAKEILKKAVAVGVDNAFVVSNESFAGGDSSLNATMLAQAVRIFAKEASVLVFGQASLDELDGQTGLKVAELLNAPCITHCKQADWQGDHLVALSETAVGIESHRADFAPGQPAVLCVMKCDYELRGSNIKGVMKANKADIPVKTPAELALAQDAASEGAALTKVLKTAPRPAKTGTKIIDGSNPQSAVSSLLEELKVAQIL